jgi:serine/threonine-protein kinase HipA
MADGIEVVVQIAGEDVPAGRLWSHCRRGVESATFVYRDDYLARSDAYELDPSLPLRAGQHQTPGERATFGSFSDCAPDRWGRRLIARNERARVERVGGGERSFGEMEYLLGARDDARQGALRFRAATDDAYLAPESQGVPPLVELPALLGAADRLDRDEASEEELQLLLRGGSSLGGARPKAHVIDGDGRLAIAKFPSPSNDDWDVIRWEAVALRLAREAGIAVPNWTLETVDGKAVLVTDRFDRDGDWRVGYVSAMTMLELVDGDRGSYLDIAEVIEAQSPCARDDLHELWRRIVFTVLISNTDDHLRNHGFLRTSRGGWTLSPAFDLNPDPRSGPAQLSTAIDGGDTTASVDLALRVAPHFRLDAEQARRMVAEVRTATAEWRTVAKAAGIPAPEIDRMAPAFSMSD